jgi:hypothetical protein
MWTVYERLGDDGHIKHECATAPKKITTRSREKGEREQPRKTHGMLSIRNKYDFVGGPCMLGEESIDMT